MHRGHVAADILAGSLAQVTIEEFEAIACVCHRLFTKHVAIVLEGRAQALARFAGIV